jgi:nuclear transport factor 2 (NTF2) superfamily protein
MRNRSELLNGRNQIKTFLTNKWEKELDDRLSKEIWAYTGDQIAVRFAYDTKARREWGASPASTTMSFRIVSIR